MQIHVQAKILIEGEKPISIFSRILVDFRYDAVSSFSAWIPLDAGSDVLNFFNKHKSKIGKKITLVISSGRESEDHLTFMGLITQISFFRSQAITPELLVRAEDPSKILMGNPNTRCFIEKSFDEIFDLVTKDYPKSDLKISKVGVKNPWKYDYLVQYNESDYQFLRRICNDTGNWFLYNGKELIVGVPEKKSERKVFLGNTISEFTLDFQTIPIKYKSEVYNYRESKMAQFSGSESDYKGKDNPYSKDLLAASSKIFPVETKKHYGDQFADQKELEAKAKVDGQMQSTQLLFLQGSGRDPGLAPGNFISIFSPHVPADGLVKVRLDNNTSYGSYMVTRSLFEIQQGGELLSDFEALATGFSAAPLVPGFDAPPCETQPAKVVSNEDPDGLGRVKVKFSWMENETTPWIRINSIYAGKEYGYFWIPEIDDQVLVGFEDNSPDKPFVIGALYHKEANQKAYQVKNNEIKSFKTKSGNEIKFLDKPGEEEITILNPGGKNEIILSLKSEVTITINSDNIKLNAKKITINGDESVEINSKSVAINGQKEIKIKGAKIESAAQSEHKISAGAALSLKGLSGKLEASTNLDLKGGVMSKLEGGAQTIVKGGVVMIN
jgi:type VI secretion system secreted protein VgrG